MERNRVVIGDARQLAAQLEPQSVQTIVTSPPYFSLRSYLDADHPDKAHEMGSEPTPAAFVASLVGLFEALRPALRDDGTMWVNLGDSYASSPPGNVRGVSEHSGLHGASSDKYRATLMSGHATKRDTSKVGIPPKSLLMIPARFAIAMQDAGWVLRSEIVWAKPSPMPESVTDRPTKSHEMIYLFAKKPTYYYDAEAIAEPSNEAGRVITLGEKSFSRRQADGQGVTRSGNALADSFAVGSTRNKRTVWTVSPGNFPGAHYATFPPDLIRPCILAGAASRACAACGTPWRRVVERSNPSKAMNVGLDMSGGAARTSNPQTSAGLHRNGGGVYSSARTLDWQPACRCGTQETRPSLVLDPFMGSGTVAEVCHQEGRDWLGFDLDERSITWTAERLAALPIAALTSSDGVSVARQLALGVGG